jgi:phage regulator Rha-like protein
MRNRPPNIKILTIRGQKVVLDGELAAVYGVTTKRLNEQFRRNRKRFPEDFAFQLTAEEYAALRSQIATLDKATSSSESKRSQTATLKLGRGQHRKYLPWAFTEHGALQVANILRSERAIAMSVYVIRAFIELREKIAANAAILKRLAEIDKSLLEHDTALREIYQNFCLFSRLCRNLPAGKSDFITRYRPIPSIESTYMVANCDQ